MILWSQICIQYISFKMKDQIKMDTSSMLNNSNKLNLRTSQIEYLKRFFLFLELLPFRDNSCFLTHPHFLSFLLSRSTVKVVLLCGCTLTLDLTAEITFPLIQAWGHSKLVLFFCCCESLVQHISKLSHPYVHLKTLVSATNTDLKITSTNPLKVLITLHLEWLQFIGTARSKTICICI